MKAPDLLRRAAEIMDERGKQYDKPDGERSMGRAVTAFNAITGRELTEAEGWLLLQVLKDVRQWQNPNKAHQDSLEDCIAYASLKAESMLDGMQSADLIGVSAQSDDEGWIDWHGGECPVDLDTVVDCIYDDGFKAFGTRARNFSWKLIGSRSDIAKYRIHKEK